ncbi:hypothetical protein ACJX0J_038125 [Zea mays]
MPYNDAFLTRMLLLLCGNDNEVSASFFSRKNCIYISTYDSVEVRDTMSLDFAWRKKWLAAKQKQEEKRTTKAKKVQIYLMQELVSSFLKFTSECIDIVTFYYMFIILIYLAKFFKNKVAHSIESKLLHITFLSHPSHKNVDVDKKNY